MMESSLQKVFTCMAVTVDPEVYDDMIADLQRAISAEIETAVAPWREGQRIAEQRIKELEGALQDAEDKHETTKLLLRVAKNGIKLRNQLLSRISMFVDDADVMREVEALVPQPKVEPKAALGGGK